jgi:hypothetical protein
MPPFKCGSFLTVIRAIAGIDQRRARWPRARALDACHAFTLKKGKAPRNEPKLGAFSKLNSTLF